MNASLALAASHPAVARLAEVDENKVTPGLLGFVVFAAIGAAVWFLMKSMNKQFKKVNFEVEPDPSAARAESRAAEPARQDGPREAQSEAEAKTEAKTEAVADSGK